MVRVLATGTEGVRGSGVLPPIATLKRCKGCGEVIAPHQRWCGSACQRAEDPEYREDEYDHDTDSGEW